MRRLGCILGMLLFSQTAFAYVQTTTSTGKPVEWRAQCPELHLDATENPDLSTEQLRSDLQKSADAWNDATSACNNPRITIAPGTVTGKDIKFDGTDVILWRLPGFCDDPAHASDEVCLSPSAAAVTTVFHYDKPGDPKDGELLETDVEINATKFHFGDDGSPDKVDIGNTMTHEFGHVLGLDHTCTTVNGAAPPLDSTGKPVPFCFPTAELAPSITRATMYNFETPGETSKREPQPDEVKGICAVYAQREAVCAPPDAPGCTFIPGARVVPLGMTLIILGAALGCALAWRRRS